MKLAVSIYLNAVKVFWKYKLLIFIPIFNIFLAVFILRANRNYPGLPGLLSNLFELAAEVIVGLLIIVIIFKDGNAPLFDASVWGMARKYFWRVIGINVASVFALLFFVSPLCFFLFLLLIAKLNNIFSVLLVFVFLVFMVLFFGTNLLGVRVLISQNKKIVESMWVGYQELKENYSHYFVFMVIAFLTSFMPLIVANITSVTQTGLTVFSVPFIPYDVFQENYRQVMGTISDLNMFRLFIVLLSYFIKPVNIAAITLAYMNRLSLYNNQALITEIVN